jgi:hypothetical protein
MDAEPAPRAGTAAAGADLAVDSLADTAAILRWILGGN